VFNLLRQSYELKNVDLCSQRMASIFYSVQEIISSDSKLIDHGIRWFSLRYQAQIFWNQEFLTLNLFPAVLVTTGDSAPPDFNHKFTGFTQLTKLLIKNCTNILGQVLSCRFE
jgi:hypothetical protein